MPSRTHADPVVVSRAFHRHGQTFIQWREQPDSRGYHLYRSRQPITAASIAGLRPVELNGEPMVIPPGSSRIPACHRFFDAGALAGPLFPDTIRRFHDITNWTVDPLKPDEQDVTARLLSDGAGFVVWTPAAGHDWQGPGAYHYAVVAVGGRELGDRSTVTVEETADRLQPLLVWQAPGRRTRLYLQYMALQRSDTVDWNPRGMGYASFYSVEVPADYDFARPEPLPAYVSLHAGASQALPAYLAAETRLIRIMPNDRPIAWWYGWSAAHDYSGKLYAPPGLMAGICHNDVKVPGPSRGPIVNYMETMVLRALVDTADMADIAVDEQRVFVEGPSMGATGALALGVRYPNVFSAAIAERPPVVNARSVQDRGVVCAVRRSDDPNDLCNEPILLRDNSLAPLVGEPSADLPIVNQSPWLGTTVRAPMAAHLAVFNGLPVYDWMDPLGMLAGERRGPAGERLAVVEPNLVGAETAFLMIGFGYRDCAASWDTQGRPAWRVLNRLGIGHTGIAEDLGHQLERFERLAEPWPEYLPPVPRFAAPAMGLRTAHDVRIRGFDFPLDESYPAFIDPGFVDPPVGRPIPHGFPDCPTHDPNAPAIAPLAPSFHNLNVVWRGGGLPPVIDREHEWMVTIRLEARVLGNPGGADYRLAADPVVRHVMPRRARCFRPGAGDLVQFVAQPAGQPAIVGWADWDGTRPIAPNIPIGPEGTTVWFRTGTAERRSASE